VAIASASRALEIARRLDDPNLQSMALDALAGTSQVADGWRGSLEYSKERVIFQARLSMVEKLDAYGMVVWSAALLGDLDQADRVSAEGVAQVQPGQVPGPTLHLVSWRTYVLMMLGRWDEALTMAERARQLWIDLDRGSMGYALHGFMAAIDIARSRQDQQLIDLYVGIHDEIVSAFPEGSEFSHWRGYGSRDLTTTARAVERFRLGLRIRVDRLERALSRLLDQDYVPPASTLETIVDYCREHELPIVEAQAQRGLGRAHRNIDRLERSISLFDRAGAIPYAARVRCERALLKGDHGEMRAGLAVLERLGDAEQISRFERLQVG
jgi:tetratricopeptide (TPR) repeat protein